MILSSWELLEEAVARANGGSVETVIDAQGMRTTINPAAPGKNTAYDTMDQSRQIGMGSLTPQMSRQAMFNFLDAEGGPMQQLRARDAGLGLLREGGNYYANINGQMQPISQKQYNSIVRRDEGAIAGLLQNLDDDFRMPGGNAPRKPVRHSPALFSNPCLRTPVKRMKLYKVPHSELLLLVLKLSLISTRMCLMTQSLRCRVTQKIFTGLIKCPSIISPTNSISFK